MGTMYLDRKKAKKLVLDEIKKDSVLEAKLVLSGDEFWNTETIYCEGKFCRQKSFKCYPLSYWAMPTLVIEYTDGKNKRIPCYTLKKPKGIDDLLKKQRERACAALKTIKLPTSEAKNVSNKKIARERKA